MNNVNNLLIKLDKHGQKHVLKFLDVLDEKGQKQLTDRLNDIDFDLLEYSKNLILSEDAGHYIPGTLEPLGVIELPVTEAEKEFYNTARLAGEELISKNKVGVVLVAGGQGTRLGFDAPKGTFPVGPITQRTLFQYHTEKILARERKFNTTIPFYIMTSELNYQTTIDFFEQNNYFGKAKSTFIFFKQGMLPTLNEDGGMFLAAKDEISVAPDGHGGLLRALYKNNLLEDMEKRGVEYLYYFQVDSPLANVSDPVFIGYHKLKNAEMSAKTVYKCTPYEKLGNIGRINEKPVVIEYTELTREEMELVDARGKLTFGQGSIGIHVFSVSFLRRLKDDNIKLPYHIAHKKIPFVNEQGDLVNPEKPNGYKFEQFIFDALPFASQIMIMETDRKTDFSPIKNKEGDDSPATARRDLCNLFGEWLEKAGKRVNRDEHGNVTDNIEISPLFALEEEDFRARLKKSPEFKQGYLFE